MPPSRRHSLSFLAAIAASSVQWHGNTRRGVSVAKHLCINMAYICVCVRLGRRCNADTGASATFTLAALKGRPWCTFCAVEM